MAAWNMAVVGATGAVGSAIIELLQERQLAVADFFVLASDDNEGETIRFAGKNCVVQTLRDFDWSQVNIAFFAAPSEVAQQHAIVAADMGCIVIDCSGLFSEQPEVPLIVPGVNDYLLSDYRSSNIIATPNGIVSQLVKAVTAITETDNILQLQVSSYLPASFYGKSAVDGLAGQSVKLLNGLSLEESQLAFNLQPVVTSSRQNRLSETKLVEQCRRILANEQLQIAFNLLDVPVFYGLSQSIGLTMQYPVSLDDASHKITMSNDIELTPNEQIATPVMPAETRLALKIGDLHYAYGMPEQLQLWAVSDNVRYLGALMAVETVERLVQDYL